jgi:antitoxin ParD1/3/4
LIACGFAAVRYKLTWYAAAMLQKNGTFVRLATPGLQVLLNPSKVCTFYVHILLSGRPAMNVNFPPVDENFIRKSVDGGLYSNANELVRDAVRRLRESEERHIELLAAIQLGEDDIAQGRTGTYSREMVRAIRDRVLKRAASGEKPKSDVTS